MRRMAACVTLSSLLMMGSTAADPKAASDMSHPQQPASAEFQKIRALAGTWKGTAVEMDGTERPAVVEYLVTSGGSAVVETLFPGTDHAMVSVYHQRNGRLAMTHYCMLGNQPQLGLTKATADEIDLSLIPGPSVDEANDSHMHSLTLTWADADHVKQTWTLFEHGKPAGSTTFTLARER